MSRPCGASAGATGSTRQLPRLKPFRYSGCGEPLLQSAIIPLARAPDSVNSRGIASGVFGIGNALLPRGLTKVFLSNAVELKSYAACRAAWDSNVRLRRLELINSRKPEFQQKSGRLDSATFPSAETRHIFAIWALEKDTTSRRRLHLYYCVRCKWAFSVDDRRGVVTPLDVNGNPIQAAETADRLATFALGPCPAFSRLIADSGGSHKPPRTGMLRKHLAVRIAWVVAMLKRLRIRRSSGDPCDQPVTEPGSRVGALLR